MRIESYFGNMKEANGTVEKLKTMGYKSAFIDINEGRNEDRNLQTNLAGTETAISLSDLVLEGTNAKGTSMDKSPLKAASPMVSGMGTFDEIADVKCRLVVEAGENDKDKIEQIIREAGGMLDNPNIRKPRLRNDAEISINNTLLETREFLESQEKR